jgi:hypothetical protein
MYALYPNSARACKRASSPRHQPSVSFALYLAVYLPRLVAARVDGNDG